MLICDACDTVQRLDNFECDGCGVYFNSTDKVTEDIDYLPLREDVPVLDSLQDLIHKYKDIPRARCMWDNVPPGQVMGMVCPCPKCSPYSHTMVSIAAEQLQTSHLKVPEYRGAVDKHLCCGEMVLPGQESARGVCDCGQCYLPPMLNEPVKSSLTTIPEIGSEEWDDMFDKANQLNFGNRDRFWERGAILEANRSMRDSLSTYQSQEQTPTQTD